MQYKNQYTVPSFSSPQDYMVSERFDGGWECGCPHWIHRHGDNPGMECKHIKQVRDDLKYHPKQSVHVSVDESTTGLTVFTAVIQEPDVTKSVMDLRGELVEKLVDQVIACNSGDIVHDAPACSLTHTLKVIR